MPRAVMHRDGKGRMTDGATCYRIPGYPHLRVEPQYDDPDDRYDGLRAEARLYAWQVRDERFSAGTDQFRRWQVITVRYLADVREWVLAGGPTLWDPAEKEKDVRWRPIPDVDSVREAIEWSSRPKSLTR